MTKTIRRAQNWLIVGWTMLVVLSVVGGPAPVASATVPALVPVTSATPTISDATPVVDQELTLDPGVWGPEPITFTYQWYKGAKAIVGATGRSYHVQGADAGSKVKVSVTGSSPGYTTAVKISSATSTVAKAAFAVAPGPVLNGTARVGMTMTVEPGAFDPAATFTFQWYRGTSKISGATKASYAVGTKDLGRQIKVRVSAARTGYVTLVQYSGLSEAVRAGMTAATPTISDTTPQVGQTLTVAGDQAWTPSPDKLTIQWFSGSTQILDANGLSYTVQAADLSAKLKVTLTGAKADYADVTKTSAATSSVAAAVFTTKPLPTIAGVASVGATLTAEEGGWVPSPDSFTYQWFRAGTAIAVNGTGRSYVPVASDAGKAITVRVTAKRAGFTSATTISAVTSPRESTGADLRVATFNISGQNDDSKATGDYQVWAERLPIVTSQIIGEGSDVVALQEAYAPTGQYTSLTNALAAAGKAYAITDGNPYASQATRIMYNTTTVTLLSKGAFGYNNQVAGKTTRYLSWATFRQLSTGKDFFFVSTHLSPDDEVVRLAEWKELLEKVKELNPNILPVVVAGDFNTTKFTPLAAEMLPAMKAAGFGDLMNQEFQVNPPRSPRAESVVNGWINSFNGYRRNITPYSYPTAQTKVGNGIDWIFATNSLRVKQWKVVIDFDPATMLIRGVIPSDHNMIGAILVL